MFGFDLYLPHPLYLPLLIKGEGEGFRKKGFVPLKLSFLWKTAGKEVIKMTGGFSTEILRCAQNDKGRGITGNDRGEGLLATGLLRRKALRNDVS